MITGWGEAVGSNEQKAAGVDWVIAKPFTADRIAELVYEINKLNATRRSKFHHGAANRTSRRQINRSGCNRQAPVPDLFYSPAKRA